MGACENALYYNVYKKVGDYDYKLVEATFDTNYSENIFEFTSYRVTAVTFTYDDEMVETDFQTLYTHLFPPFHLMKRL